MKKKPKRKEKHLERRFACIGGIIALAMIAAIIVTHYGHEPEEQVIHSPPAVHDHICQKAKEKICQGSTINLSTIKHDK